MKRLSTFTRYLMCVFFFILLACNSKMKKLSPNYSENKIKGTINRSLSDSTTLIFSLKNVTQEEFNIPKELGAVGNEISFILPSGKSSKFKNPNGSWGQPHVLKVGEEFSYYIPNYEYFMLTNPNIERDESGWFTLHWKMEHFSISESIKIYYDYEAVRKKLDKN